MSRSNDQAVANYKTQRTYQIGFESLFSSLLANLDIVAVASQLQLNGCITSAEYQQITEWSSKIPKDDTLHAFLLILSKSPLRLLKTAIKQCPNSLGHKELLKQIEAMGVFGRSMDEPESGLESELADSQLSINDPMVSLSWKQLSSMPVGMKNSQARVLGNKVYVGGGTTGMIDLSSKVYVYDYVYDKWEAMSKSPVYNFALEVYNDSILLIGGRETDTGEVTGGIFYWDQEERAWKDSSLPPMPTARHSASSTTYGQTYIVVAGGFAVTSAVSRVEVYSENKQQWLSAQSLPKPQSHMKQVLANGSWILMGGSDDKAGSQLVFSASLEALVSNAEEWLLPTGTLGKPIVWRTMPPLPYTHSSAAYFGNSVVAMGREGGVSRSPVYAYSPDTLTWNLVSELPLKIEDATIVTVPSGDVMILGGVGGEPSEHSKLVYVSSLQSNKEKAEKSSLALATVHRASVGELRKEPIRLESADAPMTSTDTGAPLSRTVWASSKIDRVSSQSSIRDE